MSRAAIAAPTVFEDVSPLLGSVRRSKRMAFALLLVAYPSVCRLAATRLASTAPKRGPGQFQLFSRTCRQNW